LQLNEFNFFDFSSNQDRGITLVDCFGRLVDLSQIVVLAEKEFRRVLGNRAVYFIENKNGLVSI
jgi:hypothetical protein